MTERERIAVMWAGPAVPRFAEGDPRNAFPAGMSALSSTWKMATRKPAERVGLIDQALNGTGLKERIGLLNSMFNPVTGLQEAGQHSEDMLAPGKTAMERVGSLGGMLSGMAGTVAPMVAASKGTIPAADAVMEAVAGYSAMPRAVAGDFLADEFGGLRLYHGSPHDFDKFSMDKIGTGEGAQAYGHGLYFAENEDVAKAYRDSLQFPRIDGATTPVERVADDLNYHRGDVDSVRRIYEGMIKDGSPEARKLAEEKLAALPEALDRFKGRMYEVEVNADPEDFLDWDAPLSEQPQKVRDVIGKQTERPTFEDQEALIEALRARGVPPEKIGTHPEFKAMERRMDAASASDAELPSGDAIYRQIVDGIMQKNGVVGRNAEYGAEQGASKALREAGIPGIKYLDAGSRGAGDGSRNYVVFDENLISIVRKYGIAGAAAMLGMSQADVAQATGIKDDKQAATNAQIAKMMRPQ